MKDKYVSRWYHARRMQGLCIDCGKPAQVVDGVTRARCEECSERIRSRSYQSSEPAKKQSICWECVHSVPCREYGQGCEWSKARKPVEGWQAEECTSESGRKTFRVISCPKYRKGRYGETSR